MIPHSQIVVLAAIIASAGCMLQAEDGSENEQQSGDQSPLLTTAKEGSKARATGDVNLRKEASVSSDILAVIPKDAVVELVSATPTDGFYNVSYNTIVGFTSAKYLATVSEPAPSDGAPGDVNGAVTVETTMARARAGVGFSYYWGGGAWHEKGVSEGAPGSCDGNCPSCTHAGKFGADCSGFVAKVWQFGSKNLATNAHPYSTGDFDQDASGKWRTIKREELKAGDALVYNTGSAGHIVLYDKGDGWGSPTVYECRGCAYGCVHNARSFASNYHAIRRATF
jgi:cell wall-associated NlpC family hydrolase